MLSTVDKVLFMMRSGITAGATTDALSRLASAAQEGERLRGDRLFQSGDEADALYIILDGAVRVDLEEGPPRMAETGDWVGALALLTHAPHTGTATVVVGTRLLRIDRADFEELLDEDGELARTLLAALLRTLTALIPSASESA